MKEDSFAKELIDILDQSMNLIRQDLVTLRNEVLQQKLDIVKILSMVEDLEERKELNLKLITVIIGGFIGAGTSIIVAIIEYFRR